MSKKTAILIIPARLASSRLPEKPLHLIQEKPLIQHVFERCRANFQGRIVIACCCERIQSIVTSFGAEAILTDPNLPSGSDRAYAAYKALKATEDYVIVMQGDMIVFPDNLITRTLDVFSSYKGADVATAVTHLPLNEAKNPNNVKVAFEPIGNDIGKALYFSRSVIPYEAQNPLKHVGIYIYKSHVLKDYVSAKPSALEEQERLEQLRGLSLGFRYGAALIKGDFYSVDTLEDVFMSETYLRQFLN